MPVFFFLHPSSTRTMLGFCMCYIKLGNYPSRCSAAKGAELDSAAAKQKAPFAAVWREAGAYII